MQNFVNYKNIQIAYATQGKGEVIVLLHGFLESSDMWRHTIPLFENTHQVVTIDLLGHGFTDSLGYIHSMQEMSRSVKAVLDYLKIEKVSFLAHSMGGYVALYFTELFPEKTKNLWLLNSSTKADSVERKNNRTRAQALVKQNKDAFVRMAIKNLFAEATKNKHQKQVNRNIAIAQKMSVQSIVASIEGLKTRKDTTQVLKSFAGQKLIFTGKKDPIIPLEDIKNVATETGSKLVVFPNGHMSYIEDQEVFLEAMGDLKVGNGD